MMSQVPELSRSRVALLMATSDAVGNACRQAHAGSIPLTSGQVRLISALVHGAGLDPMVGTSAGGVGQTPTDACDGVLRVYTWFWPALYTIEKAAPGTLEMLPGLITPLSVLDALRMPTDGLVGMDLAQEAVAGIVARLRSLGSLGPASWNDAQHPFTVAFYPLDEGGNGAGRGVSQRHRQRPDLSATQGLAVLRRGDAVIAHAVVSARGDRVQDLTILNEQLLPLWGGGRMRLVDPRPALADLLGTAVGNIGPDQVVGALDVPDSIGARVLYGARPGRRFGLVRFNADQIGARLEQDIGPALYAVRDASDRDDAMDSEGDDDNAGDDDYEESDQEPDVAF
jgi:hypothetical protein